MLSGFYKKEVLDGLNRKFERAVCRYFNSYGYFILTLSQAESLQVLEAERIESYLNYFSSFGDTEDFFSGNSQEREDKIKNMIDVIEDMTVSHPPHELLAVYDELLGKADTVKWSGVIAILASFVLFIAVIVGIPKDIFLLFIVIFGLSCLPVYRSITRIKGLREKAFSLSREK